MFSTVNSLSGHHPIFREKESLKEVVSLKNSSERRKLHGNHESIALERLEIVIKVIMMMVIIMMIVIIFIIIEMIIKLLIIIE